MSEIDSIVSSHLASKMKRKASAARRREHHDIIEMLTEQSEAPTHPPIAPGQKASQVHRLGSNCPWSEGFPFFWVPHGFPFVGF